MNSRFREWMKEWKIDEKNEWKEDRDGMKVKELKKNEWMKEWEADKAEWNSREKTFWNKRKRTEIKEYIWPFFAV